MRLSEEALATIDELKRWNATGIQTVNGGAHPRVYYTYNNKQRYIVVSGSGSDHRGPEKARKVVRHELGVVGMTPPKIEHPKHRGESPGPKVPIVAGDDPWAKLKNLVRFESQDAPPEPQPEPEPKPEKTAVEPAEMSGGMRIEELMVTPEMARSWLQSNDKNRPLRASQVETIAAAIKRGEWKRTHQPVAIDKEGRLLDGQHRLSAIIYSGVTVPMLVAFDAPRETFDCIDIGVKRSLGDILHLSSDQASTLRLVTSMIFSLKSPTPQQCEPVWPYLRDPMEELFNACSTKRRFITNAPVISGAVIRMLGGERHTYVTSLWRALALMELDEMPPIAGAFIKLVMGQGQGRSLNHRPLFAKAMALFKEENEDKTVLRLTPEDAEIEARAIMYAKMGIRIAPTTPHGKKVE